MHPPNESNSHFQLIASRLKAQTYFASAVCLSAQLWYSTTLHMLLFVGSLGAK